MNRLKKIFVLGVTLAMIVSLSTVLVACGGTEGASTAPGEGSAAGKITALRYGGTSSSSSAYAWVVAMAEAINTRVPEVRIDVMETGAAVENLNLLARGDIDLGLGTIAAGRAFTGIGDFEGKANPDLRFLWAWTNAPHAVFVRADSGIESIYDLDGKPFGAGLRGSDTEWLTTTFFEVNGIHPEWFRGDTAAMRDATKNRQILGYSKSGEPDPSVLDVATAFPIRLLPIPQEAFDKAAAAFPTQFVPATLAAGTYPGQEEDVPSFAIVGGDITTKDLPEDLAYKMAKAIYEAREELVQAYPLGKKAFLLEFPSSRSLEVSLIPLHTGVIKFAREMGVEVPERLIPPEAR